ncbi:DUF4192 domain-containing protein [Nakamurella aerolata]|uniref:DUF4192 domain-containing protein n=1 Tax=Nakamurella aerolata TaxID=1656892 RepID=A0A849A6N5_9ACTN|nr:DUF4192 domain-containing protein [Nakamurella aerolata]NNG34170.1 DUF4192 domain-containing protein [Nakamurella aerolata]
MTTSTEPGPDGNGTGSASAADASSCTDESEAKRFRELARVFGAQRADDLDEDELAGYPEDDPEDDELGDGAGCPYGGWWDDEAECPDHAAAGREIAGGARLFPHHDTPDPDSPAVIKVRDAAGLLAAVPHTIGFRPEESIVVLIFTGPRNRIGPSMRLDLPPAAQQRRFASHVAGLTLRHGTTAALFSYSSSSLGRQVLRTVLKAFLRKGIRVIDAIAVRGNEASFLPGPDGRTEPSIAVPADGHPVAAALSAANAFAGRAVLDSRAELAASIAGPADGIATNIARQRIAAAQQRHREARRAVPTGIRTRRGTSFTTAQRIHAEQLLHACVASFLDQHLVPPDLAADLAVAVEAEVSVRDHLICLVIDDRETAWTPVLSSCLQSVNPSDAVALCTMLGVAAYRAGGGALAAICFEQALTHRPDYRLARLMQSMLWHAVEPRALDGMRSLDSSEPAATPARR